MKNQSAKVNLFRGKPNPKVFATQLVSMVTLLVVLLASSLSRASAADIKYSAPTAGGLPCGIQPISEPICGYIQAHSTVDSRVTSTALSSVLAAEPQPRAYDAQLMMTRSILVRSGPGQNFYSFGELPAAFVSRVIGVNQAGDWWVIPLPLTVAPDGMGWVDAASASASNVAMTQNGISVCSDLAICGYIKAQIWQNLPVLEPSYATEKLLGLPMIVVTGN